MLRLIALGHTNAEIAEQLFLSVRTVESHRAHIQQKLRLQPSARSSSATRSSTDLLEAEPASPQPAITARRRQPTGDRELGRRPARTNLERAAGELDPLAHADQAEAAGRGLGSKPRPSSRTRTATVRRSSARRSSTRSAPACLATLVSASWTTR